MAGTSLAVAPYEVAGPSLLAKTPALLRPTLPDRPNQAWQEMRDHLEQRLYGLRNWRLSWWQHWARLAENILPRRYHWLIVPNTMTRGLPINQAIVDPTGTQAVRICAAGMKSGLMSTSRPWFKLRPGVKNFQIDQAGQLWLDEVEDRAYKVLAGSNFYDSATQMFEDLVVFGTAPMIIYEDRDEIIRCYNPCAGEYYLAAGGTFRVESHYRLFVQTVAQLVDWFQLENVGDEVAALWGNKGASLETEFIVAHAIEPNFSASRWGEQNTKIGVVPGGFAYREYYWLWGRSTNKPLSVRGFREKPFIAPRWATTSNDAYGRSPGMDALPDILQLQVMTRRLAEAIEKQVRPPMQADVGLKNEPASILPGHITYVANVEKGGMRPIYEVEPDVQHMEVLIEKIETRVQRWFYNDIFQMLAEMEGVQPRNEMEIAERRGEKLQVLGPVVEKVEKEAAAPALHRVISIMDRRGLLPPRPPSMQGIPIDFEFISMLSVAQRAASTAVMERGLAAVAKAGEVFPEAPPIDIIDGDEWSREYLDRLTFPTKPLRSPAQVEAIRKGRAQAQQAAKESQDTASLATHTVPALAGAAKDVGDIDTGGALNAIQMLFGQGGAAPGAQGLPQ